MKNCNYETLTELVVFVVEAWDGKVNDRFTTDFEVEGIYFEVRSGCENEGIYRVRWPRASVGRLTPVDARDAAGAWQLWPTGSYDICIEEASFGEAIEAAIALAEWAKEEWGSPDAGGE